MISVGLPVVKTEFVEQAINSILNQSFTDFELIILNNGANEKLNEIVNKYDDDRIKYHKNDTMLPIIENWNKVLSLASRKLFVLFSDDDVAEPDFLKELFYLSNKYPDVQLFHTRVKIIDENSEIKYVAPSCPEYESAVDYIWHRIKNYRLNYLQDHMVRTAALLKIGGYVEFHKAWNSDDATWFKIANMGGVAASSKILFNWRVSKKNLARTGSVEEKIKTNYNYINWLKNFLKDELKVSDEEEFLLKQIYLNLPFKYVTLQAYALSMESKLNFKGIIKLVYYWIIYTRKYNLSLITLFWSLGIIRKIS